MGNVLVDSFHSDQNHDSFLKFMSLEIWTHIPPRDTEGFQTSHQIHLQVSECLLWKPLVSWGGIWAQIRRDMKFKVLW